MVIVEFVEDVLVLASSLEFVVSGDNLFVYCNSGRLQKKKKKKKITPVCKKDGLLCFIKPNIFDLG